MVETPEGNKFSYQEFLKEYEDIVIPVTQFSDKIAFWCGAYNSFPVYQFIAPHRLKTNIIQHLADFFQCKLTRFGVHASRGQSGGMSLRHKHYRLTNSKFEIVIYIYPNRYKMAKIVDYNFEGQIVKVKII